MSFFAGHGVPPSYARASSVNPADRPSRPYHHGKHYGGKTTLTDAQVLEFRARYQFGGESRQKLAAEFGLEDQYAYRLLTYETRSRLVPTRAHLPVKAP
jgi:hypothetical protein